VSALFLFASLGVINGILLSVYLFAKKDRRIVDIYFGGLILSLCIRIGKSVLAHFDEHMDKLILQIGLSACLFIGPLFYLYARSLQQNELSAKKKDIALLIVLAIAVIIVGILMPYRTEPEFWNTYIIKVIYLIWALFLVMGLFQTRSVFAKLFTSPSQLKEDETYILGIALSVVFITITYQTALWIKGFTYMWGSIIFSISFYYLAGRKILGKKAITPKTTTLPPLENGKALLRQVQSLMVKEKPYLDPKLKLDQLATQAGISRHLLSQLLNEEYKHGFSYFVREHRVNEAKRLIEVRHELSLEGIGFEAGFNSKSAFFEAFKKATNLTPAAYKKSSIAQNQVQSTPD